MVPLTDIRAVPRSGPLCYLSVANNVIRPTEISAGDQSIVIRFVFGKRAVHQFEHVTAPRIVPVMPEQAVCEPLLDRRVRFWWQGERNEIVGGWAKDAHVM